MVLTNIQILLGFAIVLQALSLYYILKTKYKVPGEFKFKWNFLTAYIVLFLVCFSITEIYTIFNDRIPIFAGAVILLGSIFVIIMVYFTNETLDSMIEKKELEKTNQIIKNQKDFQNKVINSLKHPFYVIDINTYKIKLANTSAMMGSDRKDITCYELTHHRTSPCDTKEHDCPLRKIKNNKKPVTTEHIHFTSDGNPINSEVHAYPVFNQNGELTEMIEYSLDITKRKQAELKLKQLNIELSQAKSELEQLLEQKNEFIHILSHDLKNPLTAPLTLLPLIDKKIEDEHLKEMLQAVTNSVLKIRMIIYDTLKLARLDNLDKVLNKEDISLFDLTSKTIDDNRKMIDEFNFIIDNKVDKDLVVSVDKFLIDQVLDNLISNAIKYTSENQDQHLIILSELKDNSVVVSLRDFGKGIDNDKIENVFDKFSKNAKPREGFDSTGLGLSICKNVIEKHGGKIWVESDGVGKGSTFYFTIPL